MRPEPSGSGSGRPDAAGGRKQRNHRGGGQTLLAFLPVILSILAVGGLMVLHIVRPDAVVAGGPGNSVSLPRIGTVTTVTTVASEAPVDADAAAAPQETKKLRIATWNVRDCAVSDAKTGERISLHDGIAAQIRDLGVDIIVFEEIQRDDDKGGDIALLSVALAKAGWAMPWNASVESGGQDDLAVFSRYRIMSSEAVLEPGSGDSWPRPGIRADVDTGAGRLRLYGFHFKAMSDSTSEKARRMQATAAAALLRADLDAGVAEGKTPCIVVGGDFNTTNPSELDGSDSTLALLQLKDDSDSSNDFLAANLRYRPKEPTYVDERYRSVLDHLILSPGAARALVPGSVSVPELPKTSGAAPLSDHRPVIVELSLPVR